MTATVERPPSLATEASAGLATFLTLSYVLVLNPVLLRQAGIDISAAFFATVVSAGLATLIMGLWAKLPFAIAPAPSITTFFVSYVCLTLNVPWQGALAAVILSGILSILMAALAVRQKLIDATPMGLKIGILFSLGGFLVANGLSQAKLIQFSGGFLQLSSPDRLWVNVTILMVGLLFTLLFQLRWMRFSGAPLVGILLATVIAAFFGIQSRVDAQLGPAMFSSVFAADFSMILDWRILSAMFVFFIIDFFGGIGKFIGLFGAMEGQESEVQQTPRLGRALYVDGAGNIIGGFLGASSLAVFISSAVGIKMGARTGRAAVVTAMLIFASLIAFPLVGAIPTEATSGILIFIGFLLIPWHALFGGRLDLGRMDYAVFALAAAVAFVTFGLDKSLFVLFLFYGIKALRGGINTESLFLGGAATFLGASVVADFFLRGG